MITLDMPVDVRVYVLEYQAKIKGDKGPGQYSQQQAIIAIIREHKKLIDELLKFKQGQSSKGDGEES